MYFKPECTQYAHFKYFFLQLQIIVFALTQQLEKSVSLHKGTLFNNLDITYQ